MPAFSSNHYRIFEGLIKAAVLFSAYEKTGLIPEAGCGQKPQTIFMLPMLDFHAKIESACIGKNKPAILLPEKKIENIKSVSFKNRFLHI